MSTGGFADDPALAGGTEEAGLAPEGMDPLFPDLEQPAKPGVQRWRKKPITIKMIRWTGDNSAALSAFCGTGGPDGTLAFEVIPQTTKAVVWNSEEHAWIPVPEGHWVARGVRRELYPVSPAVLAETFEPVTDDPADSGVWADAREEVARANEDWRRGAAYERERTEALIIQAQDYAHAESERADKLAALALKMLTRCNVLERGADVAYLGEWHMALTQLEGAAGDMSPPDSDPLEDAYQEGIRAHRERILRGGREAVVTFTRPGLGNGPAYDQALKVVPWEALEKLLGEGEQQ